MEEAYSASEYREDIQRCMRCGFCRPLCPSWELIGWETGSPRGRMQVIKAILDGEVGVDDYVVDRIYQCALCGYCMWRCPAGVKTTDAIKAARAYLVDKGRYPDVVERISRNVERNHSIYELPAEARADWAHYLGVEDIVKMRRAADVVYFVGCVPALSSRSMGLAAATSMILDALGRNWTVMGEDEWCCGNPLLLSGKTDSAKALAVHNVQAVRKLGAKAVVTSCAGCYRTFAQEYPRLVGRLGFEVCHISQLLEGVLGSLRPKLKSRLDMTVAYHDPCEMGRLLGVYEPPRAVLSSIPGVKLVELPKNRQLTRCCGGGGILKATNPEMSLKLAVRKVEEAQGVGAEALVSTCPACRMNIMDGIAESGSEVQMLDLTEVVVRAMGLTIA